MVLDLYKVPAISIRGKSMSDSKWLGMYRALVVDNNDPERRGRIRVQCPTVLGTYLSAWCEPCIPYATDFAGDYYVPPVGEGIWVQFENGDIDKPIWNGGWYRINSSPLTTNSNPEDYRYMTFKNSVLRMGEREFIFELRHINEDNKSLQFEVSPSTVLGLSYIGSKTEDELSTIEEYILNKKIIFEDYPESIALLDKNKLNITAFQEFIDTEYNKTKEEISYTLDSIVKVIGDNETPDSILHSLKEISESINTLNSNLERVERKVDDLKGDVDNIKNNWCKWCETEISNAWQHIGSMKETYNSAVDDLNWNAERFDSFPYDLLSVLLRRIEKMY